MPSPSHIDCARNDHAVCVGRDSPTPGESCQMPRYRVTLTRTSVEIVDATNPYQAAIAASNQSGAGEVLDVRPAVGRPTAAAKKRATKATKATKKRRPLSPATRAKLAQNLVKARAARAAKAKKAKKRPVKKRR